MFNLLVARDPQAWESPTCRMRASRFCEFSKSYSLDDEATLRLVEQLPTLLAYEAATKSSTAHLVRHGVIHSLRLEHHDLVFEFVVDPDRGFLPRSQLREFADRIGVHRHEPYRTHWAVKPGDLPEELLAKAGPRPPPRNVPKVYAAYRDAVKRKAVAKTRELTEEIATFPPSEDKGVEFLQTVLQQSVCFPALPLLGIRPKSPESRAIVDRVIAGQDVIFDPYPDLGQGSRPLLLAPFYSRYGGPTEVGRFEEAIDECVVIASELESNYRTRQKGLRSIAYVVWQSARHPILAKHLRRRLAGLVDRMMLDRTTRATWTGSKGKSDLLATAMIAVGMQRLGDDKHRAAVCETIRSLCQKQHEAGGLPAFAGGTAGDVLATTLLLEAVQRSGFADDLAHVLERGEKWVMHEQKPSGAWRSAGWPDASVTAIVLDYFQNRSTMLPQVDGFLLMARDFFKKAMDLKAERGANNRRLATIAAVHSLEMFLYGVFERAPELGVSAYREKGDETLGPRAALSEFQAALRRSGVLANKQAMSHRDQVIALIRHRDNIIHHASEISEEELIRGVRAVRRFVTLYGVEVTGLDLLQ